MGRRRNRGRDIDGMLILDKPLGMSSNKALQIVKIIFGASKAGHTGSLDPQASGVLPICLGETTKFSRYLLDADKRYEVTMKLGEQTATGDIEGDIIRRSDTSVDAKQFQNAVNGFIGEVSQVPSMYSALKHEGQPLYKLARQGIEVERPARLITIYDIEVVDFRGDEADLIVHCSKGTYIRNLVEDIAVDLGSCAHVIALRRTMAGPYQQMISLDQLRAVKDEQDREGVDRLLLGLGTIFEGWPQVGLDDKTVYYMQQGKKVGLPEALKEMEVGTQISLFKASEKEFFGVGEVIEDQLLAPKRLTKTQDD